MNNDRAVGLLDRLRRAVNPSLDRVQEPRRAVVAADFDVFPGGETLEVVGESYRQEALWAIVGGLRREYVSHAIEALLLPVPYVSEAGDRDDPNAVEVHIQGHHVGYLSRHNASMYRPGIVALAESCPSGRVGLVGEICGGGERVDGIGMLGVFLEHDPTVFGVSARRASDMPSFRTGLSEALATDVDDDAYDLSWLRGLPTSDAAAITELRRLLRDERDPIDRHYMHCELEVRLYQSRDAFGSALDEYDAACELHHSDMVAIRPALMEKFGRMPVLDTYRQAAIRAQKARDWAGVQRWAERGIDLYGPNAGRPEAVDDLRKRLAYAAAKLQPPATRNRRRTSDAGASVSVIEVLVCTSCGQSFERERTRGRKPHTCPTCRGG
jgi:hypothetical protein